MPAHSLRIALLLTAALAVSACVVRRPGAVASSPVTAPAAEVVSVPAPAPEAPPVYEPLATHAVRRAPAPSYDVPGFETFERDGRLWVFREGSKGLAEFRKSGEPAKSVTLIGEGPNGMTLRGSEKADLDSYRSARKYARRGYAVFEEDGRIWVFRDGSADLAEFLASGEPAKSVTLVGSGPDGKTLRSSDLDTARAYMAGR